MALPVASSCGCVDWSVAKFSALWVMILCADQSAAKASWRSLSAQRGFPCLDLGPRFC